MNSDNEDDMTETLTKDSTLKDIKEFFSTMTSLAEVSYGDFDVFCEAVLNELKTQELTLTWGADGVVICK